MSPKTGPSCPERSRPQRLGGGDHRNDPPLYGEAMNYRVPSDSIERGWSLASSVCRNVPPRYAVHTFAPRPTRARNKRLFLTRTEIASPIPCRDEQRSTAERAKAYEHHERESTGQSMVAQRVCIEPGGVRENSGTPTHFQRPARRRSPSRGRCGDLHATPVQMSASIRPQRTPDQTATQ